MPSTLARSFRAHLENKASSPPLAAVLNLADEFVLETPDSIDQLEQELERIHDELVDHATLYPSEAFLAVLFHLLPILRQKSVISTWFDLLLRPALREPKLSTAASSHAKLIVLSALDEESSDIVANFRRRLFDLYLLDAFNEGSGADVIEWAQLTPEQRAQKSKWKANLEDILLRFGKSKPQTLLDIINTLFAIPSARLQLLTFLNLYTSDPEFIHIAQSFSTHPLMKSILSSLLFDNSSIVCNFGLTLLSKILPIFAVHAREELISITPRLLVILARVLCWQERPSPVTITSSNISSADDDDELVESDPATNSPRPQPPIRPEIGWEKLEATLTKAASSAPDISPLFTLLYYLFPCNVLHFLRGPLEYIESHQYESPFAVPWSNVINDNEVRWRSERLMRTHASHMALVSQSSETEFTSPPFWASYDVSRITTESNLLDLRRYLFVLRSRYNVDFDVDTASAKVPVASPKVLTLEDMIATSAALRSESDTIQIDTRRPSSFWLKGIFSTPAHSRPLTPTSTSIRSQVLMEEGDGDDQDEETGLPMHAVQAISELQREVLLLRNELNFELWLSRENIKHVGRLWHDRRLLQTAESERQGLYNKLRNYRSQVVALEKTIAEQKQKQAFTKSKYDDWNSDLQEKLRVFRKEKEAWEKVSETLRKEANESKTLFEAQKKLLAEATNQVFKLETEQKEVQHKIDRLHDYETQIAQHQKVQKLWDADFEKFNARAEELNEWKNHAQQLHMRAQSAEEACHKLEEENRNHRIQNKALEAQLIQAKRKAEQVKYDAMAKDLSTLVAEKASLEKSKKRLADENEELREIVQEMEAMVQVLKAEVQRRRDHDTTAARAEKD